MRRVLQGIAVGCALACALPAVAAAQEPTFERVLPAAGLNFDVDWTNGEYFTANNTTVSRFNLATGAPIDSSFSVPSGTINDIDAVTGGVYVATIGLSRVYAYTRTAPGGHSPTQTPRAVLVTSGECMSRAVTRT